ncbi:MAG: PTS sugar transporter subunit IIA [Leptospirales bacterium]
MKVSSLVPVERICIGWPDSDPPKHQDKWKLIKNLNSFLFSGTSHAQEKQKIALNLLIEREKSMTTGIGHGIAIPHSSIPFLKKTLGAMCILKNGIDFESIDNNDIFIVFLILLPDKQFEKHIQTLANITKLTNDPDFRNTIINLDDPKAIWDEIEKREQA